MIYISQYLKKTALPYEEIILTIEDIMLRKGYCNFLKMLRLEAL